MVARDGAVVGFLPLVMVMYFLIAVIALLFAGACVYICREKKKGRHCIGCPMAGNCAKCHRQAEAKKAASLN